MCWFLQYIDVKWKWIKYNHFSCDHTPKVNTLMSIEYHHQSCNPSWCRWCLQLWPPPTFPSCILSGIHVSTFVSIYIFIDIKCRQNILIIYCIKLHHVSCWSFSVAFLTELCPGDVLQNETFCILKIYGASIYTVTTYKVNTIRYCSYTRF